MIYSPSNEPLEIIGDQYMDLLDPTTMDYPWVDVRFLRQSQEQSRARLCRLHADGGMAEIEEALAKLRGPALSCPEAGGQSG